MALIELLAPLRAHKGKRLTTGLDDAMVARFAKSHPDLVAAIEAAAKEHAQLQDEFAELFDMDEDAQLRAVQGGFVNFYPDDAITPYIALTARGPWVVSLNGAVLYDAGGYGMLGFGHTPEQVMAAMAKPQAMANIMTPSLSQLRFDRALREEIGHTRGGCPYARFLCLNSGSESVDTALKMALAYQRSIGQAGRYRLIGRERGYHGTNFGGVSVGGLVKRKITHDPGAALGGGIEMHAPAMEFHEGTHQRKAQAGAAMS